MSIKLGIYDFFAYTIPGIFYLIIASYAAKLFGFVTLDFDHLTKLSLISVIFIAGVGYITGMILDPLARKWHLLFRPKKLEFVQGAFDIFCHTHLNLGPKIQAEDRELLKAYLRHSDSESFADIERFNASRIMLRNISFGFLLLATAFFWDFIFISSTILHLSGAFTAVVFSVIAAREGTHFGGMVLFQYFCF